MKKINTSIENQFGTTMKNKSCGGYMKLLSSLVLMLGLISFSNLYASSDEPVEYTNPNQCLDDLMGVLGANYKLVNKDVIVKTDSKNVLTAYYSNGSTVIAQPNGGCFTEKNKANDFNGVLLGAMEKAKAANHQALETCRVQQSKSVWYTIFAELGPKLKGPAKSTGTK